MPISSGFHLWGPNCGENAEPPTDFCIIAEKSCVDTMGMTRSPTKKEDFFTFKLLQDEIYFLNFVSATVLRV